MTTPMRVTIIPADHFCSVDGVGFTGVDVSSLDSSIHAVQWYSTKGEVEAVDPISGKMINNNSISNLEEFKSVLDSYWSIRESQDAAEQEEIDEKTILEV